jgi:hypothetical protein
MARLEKLIENHNELRWSEDEIAEWIGRLPVEKRDAILDCLKRARRAGLDLYPFACRMRQRAELIERRNRPTWVDLWAEATIGWTLGGIITGTKKL